MSLTVIVKSHAVTTVSQSVAILSHAAPVLHSAQCGVEGQSTPPEALLGGDARFEASDSQFEPQHWRQGR